MAIRTAVVLAAGEGARLRPFTESRPKGMLPVVNRPILEHVLRALADAGVRDVVLVVGYHHERVRDHFGDGRRLGIKLRYVEQPRQLGTGHALLQARKAVKGDFLVLNGDSVVDAKTVGLLLEARKGDAALVVAKSARTRRYGVVQRRGARITEIKEKPAQPRGSLVNTGLYRFSTSIFDELKETSLSEEGTLDLTATLQRMVEAGKDVRGILTGHLWADAVYPWDLPEMNGRLLERFGQKRRRSGGPRGEGTAGPGTTVRGPVSIGRDSVIHPGSVVVGPVSIGERCEVGPHAVLLPGTTLGDGTTIGPFCAVHQSILMEGVRLASHISAGHSVLADGVSVGAGTVLERGPASIGLEGELHRVETGCFLGEGTRVGDRVLVRAGSILGARCEVASGSVVSGHLPSHSRVL